MEFSEESIEKKKEKQIKNKGERYKLWEQLNYPLQSYHVLWMQKAVHAT